MQGQGDVLHAGELAALREERGLPVDLLRRLQEQVDDRGGNVGGRDQLDGGSHQRQVLRREIAGQVDGARGHLYLDQEAMQAREGGGSLERDR